MKTISVVLVLGVLGGFAAAAILYNSRGTLPAPAASSAAPAQSDSTDSLENRIRALESALSEERDARQLLEDDLQTVYAELDRLEGNRPDAAGSRRGTDNQARAVYPPTARVAMGSTPEERAQALVKGGFSQDRADWIVKRESELQMQAMQAVFEARRSGEPFDRSDLAMNPDAALRAEIGDNEYERYLQATGRPTSVGVSSVLESSPAQRAGLQPGDQITAYDGQRIFNYWELNQQTMTGDPGSSVVVDIVRDGAPMQVVLQRGPLGISVGRRWAPRQ